MTSFTATLYKIREEYAKGYSLGLCHAASESGIPAQHERRFNKFVIEPLLPGNNKKGESQWLGGELPWRLDHPGRDARLMLMDLVILMHEEAE